MSAVTSLGAPAGSGDGSRTSESGYEIVDCVFAACFPMAETLEPSLTLTPQHSPISRTKLPCIVRMATEGDVVQNQMFLNSCVQLIPVTNAVLIVTHYSSPGPSTSQNAGRGCVSPFLCAVMLLKNYP